MKKKKVMNNIIYIKNNLKKIIFFFKYFNYFNLFFLFKLSFFSLNLWKI